MSRRVVLWVAFAVVHVVVAWLGFVLHNEPMGDVYRVYEPWSSRALGGFGIVGIDETWVYPQLALVPMILTHGLAWIGGYTFGWAVLVTAADAVAFAVLVGRARSRGRVTAAWFWLAAIALLGPVGIYRLDGLTVPLAILGCLWLVGRPWLAAVLLAAATWIKVWPAALLAAAVIALRRRLAVMGGALILSGMIIAAVVAAGGLAHVFGFISDQTVRGLQVEAPVSTPYLWGALLGIDGFWVYYDPDMLTFQVTGTEIDAVIAAMTPLLVVAMLAVVAVGMFQMWRGATFAALFPALSLALVAGLIVFNKVGSPQYVTWLFPSVVIGLVLERRRWAAPATLVLGVALLTLLVYPLLYAGITTPHPLAVTVLTLRNIAFFALFAWMLVRVVRVRVRARTPALVP